MKKLFKGIFGSKKKHRRPAATESNSSRNERRGFDDDAALVDLKKDQLGRGGFAKQIARNLATMTTPENTVVGIYGSWGEGKTTLLNFISSELKNEFDTIVVWFNPWRLPDEEALLELFFNELRQALGHVRNDSVKKICDSLDKILGEFDQSFTTKFMRTVVKLVGSKELHNLKKELGKVLESEKKRIVVFIDDIDRLQVNEIQAVFRLVKLVCDFPYTSYVLAFDDRLVSSALKAAFPSSEENGENFLGKIIQVPLRLPKAATHQLRNLCLRGIQDTLDRERIELPEEEAQRYGLQFRKALESRLSTPRVIKRYLNVVNFVIPSLKHETNVVDLLLIEAIRVLFPEIYSVIDNNLDLFVVNDDSILRLSRDRREDAKLRDKLIESALAGRNDAEKYEIKGLVNEIFPDWSSHEPSHWEPHWRREKRAASSKYGARYFGYGVPVTDISDVEFERLNRELQSSSVKVSSQKIKAIVSSANARAFIECIRQRENNFDSDIVEKLSVGLAENAGVLPNPEDIFPFMHPFEQAAISVAQMITSISDHDVRVRVAQSVIESSDPILFSVEVLSWLREPEQNRGEQRHYLTESEISLLGVSIVERLKKFPHSDPFFASKNGNAGRLLGAWNTWGDREELRQYIYRSLELNPKMVHDLLLGFAGAAFGRGRTRYFIEKQNYDSLVKLIDPEAIVSAVVKVHSSGGSNNWDSDAFINPLEKGVVKDFLNIHRERNPEVGTPNLAQDFPKVGNE